MSCLIGPPRVRNRGEPEHRIGIAELGSAAQRLLGLGAGDKVRPVQMAVERIVVVEQQKHRLGVALRDRRTQQGDELVSVGHGARQRDLDVRVIAVLGVGLLAGLQPELAVLVGDIAIAPFDLGRTETQAIVGDGRGRRLRSSRVGCATAKQNENRKNSRHRRPLAGTL